MKLTDEINARPFKYGYYKHTFYSLFFPLYLVVFFFLEKLVPTLNEVDFIIYHPLDDLIPFSEYFLIPYVFWYPFLFVPGIYLMMRDAKNFKKYMIFFAVVFFSASAIFFFFKNGQDLRPNYFQRDNAFVDVVKYLYSIDTNTNSLPSLHAAGSFIPFFASLKCKCFKNTYLKIFFLISALLISASTVFLKQHSILDTVAGIALAAFGFIIVYIIPERMKKQ